MRPFPYGDLHSVRFFGLDSRHAEVGYGTQPYATAAEAIARAVELSSNLRAVRYVLWTYPESGSVRASEVCIIPTI